MGLAINNNVASLTAQHNLSKTNSALGSSLEKLSTGLKVNRGADGPAALVISEKMRAQIAGIKTALDNTNKAVSMVQTGEGALNEINSLLTKVRGLALDSSNGTNDAASRAANQAEVTNALSTIDSIAKTTKFNGTNLLDGTAGITASTTAAGVSVSAAQGSNAQSGPYSVAVTQAAVKANTVGSGNYPAGAIGAADTLTLNGVQIAFNSSTAGTLTDAIKTINSVSGQTGVQASTDATGLKLQLNAVNYGAGGNFTVAGSAGALAAAGLSAGATANGADAAGTISFNGGAAVALSGSGNTLSGQGLSVTLGDSGTTAFTSVNPAAANITVTNNSMVFQTGANAGETASVSFGDARVASLGKGAAGTTTGIANLSQLDVTNFAGAQDAVRVVDKAISDVTGVRGSLGAFQANTLQSTANNLQVTLENTTAAESVIRDTDFASEIANYTKLQTQMQAGSTVLGNANQMTQLVAQLLRG